VLGDEGGEVLVEMDREVPQRGEEFHRSIL
jgi:hypothetical protein